MEHPVRNALLGLLALVVLAGGIFLVHALGRVDDPSLRPTLPYGGAPAPEPQPRPAVAERQVFFGDLHVHTGYSVDAFIFGVRAMPDDAYRFAKGEVIEHGAGYPIQLSYPLDFMAVTDHAEYLGTAAVALPDIPTVRRPLGEILREGSRLAYTRYWTESTTTLLSHGFGTGDIEFSDPETTREAGAAAWRDTIAAAERHNRPGVFTAFIGYEWSSAGIHRNVVYGSGAVPARPFSSLDSNRPRDLWTELEAQRMPLTQAKPAAQPVVGGVQLEPQLSPLQA